MPPSTESGPDAVPSSHSAAAEMLAAHLELRTPEARRILLTPAGSSPHAGRIGEELAAVMRSSGRDVQVVHLRNERLENLLNSAEGRKTLQDGDRRSILIGESIVQSPAAILAAGACDAVVLVVGLGKTERVDLERARDEVERAGGRLVGAVLAR